MGSLKVPLLPSARRGHSVFRSTGPIRVLIESVVEVVVPELGHSQARVDGLDKKL